MNLAICLTVLTTRLLAQAPIPNWCRALPRPEYKALERVPISDSWFEVYKPTHDVFAIYEPHQAEETISYLTPDQICGALPTGFDPKTYATRPWKIAAYTHDGDRFGLGGRTLEVISIPGHTPDAISLIDRANGLLFTGDTYYPAPIWLFRPETDLDAYAASIRRLAALAPQIKIVLGAHNIPVASASVLPRLVAAFNAVRTGTFTATPDSPGKALYKVDDISFLMQATSGR